MMEDRATEAVNTLAAGLGWEPPLEPTPATSAQPQGVPQQPQGAPQPAPAQTVAAQSTGQAAQPSPIAASGTETVVAADGTGDYTTVQDAINATAAGGTIRINSKVGRGTTVWITIPCKAIETERKKTL